MKAQFFIYFILFCNLNFAQNQTLTGNVWYLEKFILNGDDFTYVDNNNFYHSLSFENLDNDIILKSGYCLTMFGLVGNITNNTFSYNSFYQYILDCNFNNDDFNMLNTITSFYFFPNNIFSYSISDINNYTQLIFVNSQGNSAIYNNVNLSLQDLNIEKELITYPNPVDKTLHFKSIFEVKKIKIFSLEGKLIETYLINSESQIDVSVLKSGIYFVEFEQNEKLIRKKVIKK